MEKCIESAQLGSAAGKGDACFENIRGELGGRALEGHLHSLDDGGDGFAQRLADFFGRNLDGAGKAGDKVAAGDGHFLFFRQNIRRADSNLDFLGGALADHEVVFALDALADGRVHGVAGDADGLGNDDAAKGDDGDFRRAAADIDDHAAGRLRDGKARTDGGGHGFLGEVYMVGAGLESCFLNRALLHFRDAGGDGDHHAGKHDGEKELAARADLADEILEHVLRDLEIGNHAVAHGADGSDAAGGAPDHAFRLGPNGQDGVGLRVDCHHGRLDEDDSFAADVNEGGGGAEIDAYI